MPTLLLLVLQLNSPQPDCRWTTDLLHFALEHHVSVETYSATEAAQARALALVEVKRDTKLLFNSDDVETARRIMTAGSAAADARAWSNGDCSKFEALAELREHALSRAERLLKTGPARLGLNVEGDPLHTAYEELKLKFLADAPRRTAEQFAYQLLRRWVRELRGEQKGWAYLTMSRALTGSLDPHSAFVVERGPGGVLARYAPRHGLFGVVMAFDGLTPWGYRLKAPLPGSSAGRTGGLQAGEVLTALGGQSTIGLRYDELNRLFDQQGDEVRVKVARVTNRHRHSIRTLVLRRGERGTEVQAQTVTHQGTRVLLLRVLRFAVGTTDDVASALAAADRPEVVVLDLRGNPGGLLHEGLSTVALFDRDQARLAMRNARRTWVTEGTMRPTLWDGPLLVVVNGTTASAAEVVAGSLQAPGRALVLSATETYGKATIQSAIPDPTGVTAGELVITTSQYFVADGSSPQCDGVMPDVRIPGPAGPAERECDAPGALPAAERAPFMSPSQEERRLELQPVSFAVRTGGLPATPDKAVLEIASRLVRLQNERSTAAR